MLIRKKIKMLIETLTRNNIFIFRNIPRGIDLFKDLRYRLPQLQFNIVFDVGANIGQTVEESLTFSPTAQIYCFEPVKSTYEVLKQKMRDKDNVHCFNLALAKSKGTGIMVLSSSSDRYHFTSNLENISLYKKEELEKVEVETLEGICDKCEVKHIDFLKIDTEGYDLEVLKGAEKMLNEKRIDIVQVEAGMNSKNTLHVSFEKLKNYLEAKGYYLFGVYEQVEEWPTCEPHLRRANLVFISEYVIESNKLPKYT